jgi:hypothetical protein
MNHARIKNNIILLNKTANLNIPDRRFKMGVVEWVY